MALVITHKNQYIGIEGKMVTCLTFSESAGPEFDFTEDRGASLNIQGYELPFNLQYYGVGDKFEFSLTPIDEVTF